jgi:hypothetical protein
MRLQRISSTLLGLTAAGVVMLGAGTAAADCSADAHLANHFAGGTATEPDWTLRFRVSPRCDGPCEGAVRYRLLYASPSGRQQAEDGIVLWSSPSGRGGIDVMDHQRGALCHGEAGQCRFLDVAISEVSCRER